MCYTVEIPFLTNLWDVMDMMNDMPLVRVLLFQQSALPMPVEEMADGFLKPVQTRINSHAYIRFQELIGRPLETNKNCFPQNLISGPKPIDFDFEKCHNVITLYYYVPIA